MTSPFFDRWLIQVAVGAFLLLLVTGVVLVAVGVSVSLNTQSAIESVLHTSKANSAKTALSTSHNSKLLESNDKLLREILFQLEKG